MATAPIYSSAAMPIYGTRRRNDFINQNCEVPVNDGFAMGSEKPFNPYSLSPNEVPAPAFQYTLPFQQPNNVSYFQPPPQIGFAQNFPFSTYGVTYNGGMAPAFQPYTRHPHFQTPAPSFTMVPSFASSSSTSPQYPLTPSPIRLRKKVQKASLKSKARGKRVTRNVTQAAKGEVLNLKRKRGPNKRPPGTAFSHLLEGLPVEVRSALELDYKDCCELVNIKDVSTKQKHMFSLRHCKNLPVQYRELVPNFVCPAFLAFKGNCRSKAGRYDSADRHCKKCIGFEHINEGDKGAFPIAITRAQYRAIEKYREDVERRKQATGSDQSTEQADDQIHKILKEIFEDGFPAWFPVFNPRGESNDPEATVNATSSAQLPTNTTSAPIPVTDHFGQPSLYMSSPSELESPNECTEAFEDVINHEGESNVCDTIVSQPPTNTASVSIPIANHSEPPPPPYVPSLFNAETADQFARALMIGFAALNDKGEANFSEPNLNLNATAESSTESSTMPVPVPAEDHVEQHSFYQPLVFDSQNVKQYGPSYFTNLLNS